MFKKLRNKILILNTLTICAVIAVSFVAVYFLTMASVNDITAHMEEAGENVNTSGPGIYETWERENSAAGNVDVFYSSESGVMLMDIDASQQELKALLLRLVYIGLSVLSAVILISIFFANRAVRPLREAWDRQRRFIADASHELKTPLMTISANHDALLEHQDETVGSQREWIDHARVGADRMGSIISRLLALADAESGGKGRGLPHSKSGEDRGEKRADEDGYGRADENDARAVADLGDIIDGELAMLRPQAEKKGLLVISDHKGAAHGRRWKIPIPAYAEHDVRCVLSVLADNAVKYADVDGVVEVSVEVRGSTARGRRGIRGLSVLGHGRGKDEARGVETVVALTNTGPGIDPDDMPHIFERFYRADKARTGGEGGHGLGLSIAKAIADRNGFTLTSESEPGVLTTFRLTIPMPGLRYSESHTTGSPLPE